MVIIVARKDFHPFGIEMFEKGRPSGRRDECAVRAGYVEGGTNTVALISSMAALILLIHWSRLVDSCTEIRTSLALDSCVSCSKTK